MTPTSERQHDSAPDTGALAWAERAAFGSLRGIPVWGAILAAVVPTALGTVLDLVIFSAPGMLLMACYFLGCLAAVAFVQRKALFGPMVQPPLVISLVMPIIVLVVGGSSSGGTTSKILTVANPLISSFPVMAGTTAATVAFGLLRMYKLERSDIDPDALDEERAAKREAAAARKEERRQAEARKQSERRKSAEPPKKRPPEGQRGEARRGRPESGRKRSPEAKPGGEPQRGRGGSGRGRGGERSVPPGRGSGPRQAPGRGRPPESKPGGEAPRRPRRPRRGDSFD